MAANRKKRKYPAGFDSKSRLHNVWRAMLSRCHNQSHDAYSRYGGRGIAVCAEWLTFAGFSQWALSSGYSANLSIDRIDNDAGYFPANCRWASAKEQASNRRNGLGTLTALGETKSLIDWAKDARCTVQYSSLLRRVASGIPPDLCVAGTETELRAYRKSKKS